MEYKPKAHVLAPKIIEMWGNGKSNMYEIARRLSCSQDTVSLVLTRHLKEIGKPKIEPEYIEQEPTHKCDKCGLIDADHVGVKSEVTGLYMCVKCLSDLTIGEAKMLGGNQFGKFLKEILC